MITLDTSALLAALNSADDAHAHTVATLSGDRGPRVVPAFILAEIAFMLESRGHRPALSALLSDFEAGRYRVDCGEDDFGRIATLVERYADMRLGFTDAAVIYCAERNGGRVLTLHRRHFDVVAAEGSITVGGVSGRAGRCRSPGGGGSEVRLTNWRCSRSCLSLDW